MATDPARASDPAIFPPDMSRPPDAGPVPEGLAISWPAIWAGATAAIALSAILLTLGSGFGLAAASPWPGLGPDAAAFTITAGIWLIVMQWLSAAMGGYLAGRMRNRWTGLHAHEAFFRDSAHGFLAWATATIVVAVLALVATVLAAAQVPPELASDTVMAEVAQEVRDASAMVSIFTALSMLIGAFIASVAGAFGGQLRDQNP